MTSGHNHRPGRPLDGWPLPGPDRRRGLPGGPDVFFWRGAAAVGVDIQASCPCRLVNESALVACTAAESGSVVIAQPPPSHHQALNGTSAAPGIRPTLAGSDTDSVPIAQQTLACPWCQGTHACRCTARRRCARAGMQVLHPPHAGTSPALGQVHYRNVYVTNVIFWRKWLAHDLLVRAQVPSLPENANCCLT
jgi:hypothetical protein